MSIDNIRAAGRRTTKGAWRKNWLRKGVFAAARPYFVEISHEIDRSVSAISAAVMKLEEADSNLEGSISAAVIRLEEAHRNLEGSILATVNRLEEADRNLEGSISAAVMKLEEADRSHEEDAAASLKLASALKEEMQRFNGLLDGLHKDQLACAYRLGNLEDGVAIGDFD